MIQRNKFNIKSALRDKAHRIFPLLIIPVLVLSFMPLKANANTYYPVRKGQLWNYKELNPEYIENLNGKILYSFDVPMSTFQIEISSPSAQLEKTIVSGGLDVGNIPSAVNGSSYFNAFLRVFRYEKQHLSLENIPDGSIFNFHTTAWIDIHGPVVGESLFSTVWLTYVDGNGNNISSDSYNIQPYMSEMNYFSYSVDLPVNKPSGAKSCVVSLMIGRIFTSSFYETNRQDKVQFFNTQMTVRIDDSYLTLDQNQTIIDQNNTIINGTPEQNQQINDANDKMESAGDKLGDLNDQMQVEKPDTEDMDVSIDSLVPGTSILAYTQPILEFWENPTLRAMLIIVMTLVLVSWVMFGKKG